MLTCPRCQQPVDSQAIACPYCKNPLKAFGHPGIPLYQATGQDEYLCQTCLYDDDDTCNFPQRPHARECTLYVNRSQQYSTPEVYRPSASSLAKSWVRQHSTWLMLAGLLIISLVIALSQR
jgi:C4-type Zn-finger protein